MTLLQTLCKWWPKPKRRRFADLVAAELQRNGINCTVEATAEEFRVLLPDGNGQLQLGNLYSDYCAAPPWRRRELLERFVVTASRSKAGVPTDFAVAKANLLPVIRDAFLYEAMGLEMEAQGQGSLDIPIRPLAQRFCVGLVFDWPESMCSVDGAQLAAWNMDFDAALEVACENLYNRSKSQDDGTGMMEELAPGLYRSSWRDSYDAARLLLPSVYRDLAVRGDLVAFAPHRDCLILTGSDDPENIARAAALVEEEIQTPRPISVLPLVGHHLRWEAFTVTSDHPAAELLHKQRAMELAGCYEQQQQLLEAVYDKRGEDVHIGAYQAMHDPEANRVFSYAVWARDVDTLLPKADEVILIEQPEVDGDECEVIARLRWEDLAEFVPAMSESITDALPRYRVKHFPIDESVLRERCLELA